MGCGEGVGLVLGEEAVEGGVAEFAGGFFEAFVGGLLAGGGVDVFYGERDVVGGAESADEGFVGVGFFAAEAVVDVDRGEDEAEGVLFGVGFEECEQEGGGVGAAGEGDGEALAGVEEGAGEGKFGHCS